RRADQGQCLEAVQTGRLIGTLFHFERGGPDRKSGLFLLARDRPKRSRAGTPTPPPLGLAKAGRCT
ncbi:MAG: hypothetical protein ACRD52_14610, partial [Candidatus Acidiferrales bacterium]